MNPLEIAKRRLVNQRLVSHFASTPQEVVEWMGVMQGQDLEMAKWAIATRMAKPSLKAVEEAFAKGEILRTHLNRGTCHIVSRNDIRWMLPLFERRNTSLYKSSMKAHKIEISDDEFEQAYAIIRKELSVWHNLTRDDFYPIFSRYDFGALHTRYFLAMAETVGLVCSGESPLSYALLDERVTMQEPVTKEEAMSRLAERYFQSHAPATLDDFVMWTGLPKSDCAKAILSLGDAITTRGDYHFHANNLSGRSNPKFCKLLAAFDEILIGYKDRSAIVCPFHEPKCYNANHGMFYPVILFGNQIAGTWKRRIIEPEYFDSMKPTPTQEQRAIKEYQNYLKR